MVEGEVFRLKDLFNVELVEKDSDLVGRYAGEDLIEKSKKIQWTTESYVPVRVYVPDLLMI